jgi:hypothetical protein
MQCTPCRNSHKMNCQSDSEKSQVLTAKDIPDDLEVVPPIEHGKEVVQALTMKNLPDGLEVARPIEHDKQVVQAEKEVSYLEDDFPIPVEREHVEPSHGWVGEAVGRWLGGDGEKSGPHNRTVCGMRIKLLFILLAVGTVFILGLAKGLGVGLSPKASGKSSSESNGTATSASPTIQQASSIGGGLDDSYYSNKGAWNGSGLAHTWQTFSSDLEGQAKGETDVVMYYQHHSGAIRWMRRTGPTGWLRGPDIWEDVAVDAKNATPISAMYLMQNYTSLAHVFCKHSHPTTPHFRT